MTHVFIARRVANSLSAALNRQAMMSSMRAMGRGGGVALLPPALLYRVGVEDGKEELVRGASFGGLTLRVLRDIAACGDDARPHLVAHGVNEASHLIAPSFILKEIEVEKPSKETEKPPALVNPYFEK